MKNKKRMTLSVALAVCLAVNVCFAAPAAAAQAASNATGSTVVDTLLEVPILGGLLRLLMGGNNGATGETATGENAAEQAATPETATPETATAETAPTPVPTPAQQDGESVTPTATPTPGAAATSTPTPAPEPTATAGVAGDTATATPTPAPTQAPTAEPGAATGAPAWPAGWMAGSVAPAYAYPAGTATASAPTVAGTLWGGVVLVSDAVVRVNNREETNLGDLTADAVAMAAAAGKAYRTNADLEKLPLVALVDGAAFTGASVEPGTVLDAAAAEKLLADQSVSLVAATPKKLAEVLAAGMQDMLNPAGAGYGRFLQVSGLRFTYAITDGVPVVKGIWLADTAGERALDLTDTVTRLAIALPTGRLADFGLDAAAGYADYLKVAGDSITLRGALTALPQNCDAATLTNLLARQNTTGRIMPLSAAPFDAVPLVGSAYAGAAISCLVDGQAVVATVDAEGRLTFPGLAAGFHTLRMKEGQPGYYVSSFTGIGSRNGTDIVITNVPQENIKTAPTATIAPAVPTAAPTSAPASEATVDTTNNDNYGTVTATGTQAPATATAAPAATKRPATATAAPVKDPSAGTTATTPAPTLAPTATPAPTEKPTATPAPTPDPEELEKMQQAEKKSSQLPLYIGLAALIGCGAVLAGVLLKRRSDEKNAEQKKKEQRRRENRRR